MSDCFDAQNFTIKRGPELGNLADHDGVLMTQRAK